jgi:hypothetical protein
MRRSRLCLFYDTPSRQIFTNVNFYYFITVLFSATLPAAAIKPIQPFCAQLPQSHLEVHFDETLKDKTEYLFHCRHQCSKRGGGSILCSPGLFSYHACTSECRLLRQTATRSQILLHLILSERKLNELFNILLAPSALPIFDPLSIGFLISSSKARETSSLCPCFHTSALF